MHKRHSNTQDALEMVLSKLLAIVTGRLDQAFAEQHI